MRFSGICLITPDVPRLVRFYEQALRAKAEGDSTHADFPGLNLAIFSIAGMDAMAPGSMTGAGAGNCTLAFQVDDVEAEYQRIQALGCPMVKPAQTHPWGARAFWFRDPDGNIVDFYQPVQAKPPGA